MGMPPKVTTWNTLTPRLVVVTLDVAGVIQQAIVEYDVADATDPAVRRRESLTITQPSPRLAALTGTVNLMLADARSREGL
jgi:hypothetical protein